MKTYDLVIVGGGVCGMTAAVYAARASLSACILEKDVCGGLVNWTHTVENFPSHKSIHGMDLMSLCREQVEELPALQLELEDVEQGLLHPVGGGAHLLPLQGDKLFPSF